MLERRAFFLWLVRPSGYCPSPLSSLFGPVYVPVIKKEDKKLNIANYPHCSCGDPTLYQILQTILYLIIKLIRFRDLLFL